MKVTWVLLGNTYLILAPTPSKPMSGTVTTKTAFVELDVVAMGRTGMTLSTANL